MELIFFSFFIQYDFFSVNFKFNKSFPIKRINKPIGVKIIKYIIPITTGAINLPKISPNLIQTIFKGFNNFEFKIPKTKKIIDIEIDQTLNGSLFSNGQSPINIKTIKKTIPKLLLEAIFSIKYSITSLPKIIQT